MIAPACLRLVAALSLAIGLLGALDTACADARTLPDGRVYELVTRYEDGRESGLNGVKVGAGVPAVDGEAFDWQGAGGCCGAPSSSNVLYQSYRGPDGWQTKSLTPAPHEVLIELFEKEAQTPMFWTSDLSRTIFTTPVPYAPGDRRPPRTDSYDLYLEEADGLLDWISQGPVGTSAAPVSAYFEGATPDASEIVFASNEQLTPNAEGIAPLSTPTEYLYVRNLSAGTTELLDVDDSGTLLGVYGATIGNGTYSSPTRATDSEGTTTHAISADGSKVFFETGPEGAEVPPGVVPHLYMRDLSTQTTTAIDDPSSTGSARYEGASADGSLVFFTSDEGLDGASTAEELYEFNTTDRPIGAAAPMSSAPISSGGVLGVSAISNDGSHVYFVSDAALVPNAAVGRPNLYVYDTRSAQTAYVATLESEDVGECDETCGSERAASLIAEPDLDRPAYPTPDGEVLAFLSSGDLTGQNPPIQTSLTSAVSESQSTIQVASTTGLLTGDVVEIGSGVNVQRREVAAIDGPTEITLGSGPELLAHEAGEVVSQQPPTQVYRYSAAVGSLACVSCAPSGAAVTGSASMGSAGGGSYAPADRDAPLTEDGSRIFFESPNPLVTGLAPAAPGARERRSSVYEWENGKLALISDGSVAGATLDGTTPSGRDVFFTTSDQLTSTETDGAQVIYDAREGGGFPQAPPTPAPCIQAACRPQAGSSSFFTEPASATLGPPEARPVTDPAPAPRVVRITVAQRRALQRGEPITLWLTNTVAGRLDKEVVATISGRNRNVAEASASRSAAGTITLTLRLNATGRRWLAAHGSLELRFEIDSTTGVPATFVEVEFVSAKRASASARRRHA